VGSQEFKGIFNEPESWASPLIKFKPGAEGQERGALRPRRLIGLIANIALDPLTYIGGIGPTQKARAVASQFADDIVRFGKGELDEIAKMAGGAIKAVDTIEDVAKLKTFLTASKQRSKLLQRLNGVVKEATEYATTHTPDELASRLMREMTERAATLSPETFQKLAPAMEQMTQTNLLGRYAGSMERGAKIAGKEVGIGERMPWFGEQAWSSMKNWFGKTPVGGTLENAWWAAMNGTASPIGIAKRALGIRNPYENILNLRHKRMIDADLERTLANLGSVKAQMFEKMTPDLKTKFLQIMDTAYTAGDPSDASLFLKVLDSSVAPLLGKFKVTPEEKAILTRFWEGWTAWKKGIREAEEKAVQIGAIQSFGEVTNYLPVVQKGEQAGTRVVSDLYSPLPGFTKQKTMSVGEHIGESAGRIMGVWGDDIKRLAAENGMAPEALARQWAEKGIMSDISTDIEEMFVARSIAHAKTMKRANMIEQFREFGIDDLAARALTGNPTAVGLRQIRDPALEGLWFDGEVADILERASIASSSGSSGKMIQNALQTYSSWWKSVVTTTTGFHARNAISNNMTGFLKFGPRWFRIKEYGLPAAVGTLYALHPENFMDLAKKTFNKSEGWVMRQLNTRFGDFSVSELADYAKKTGAISGRTHGFDISEELGGLAGKARGAVEKFSPFSTKNVVFQKSREIGDIIENTPKFQSFIMDYHDMFRGEAPEAVGELAERVTANKTMLDWASLEAKKWWFDYGDLTDFEKKYLKNVMPFYTWIRKNIASQLTGIRFNPEMYQVIPKATKAATMDEGFDYSLQPDWTKTQGMFPISQDPDTGNWVMFRPDLPYKDINQLPFTFQEGEWLPRVDLQELKANIMGSAHPLIKTIVEVLPDRGWNFFKRREIKKEEVAPPAFQYLAKSPKVLQFLDGMLRQMGLNGIRVDMTRDANRVVMDGKVTQILNNNMPALRTIGMILETGEEGLKAVGFQDIEAAIEASTGKKDYYAGLEDVLQTISTTFGVKFKGLNLEQENVMRGERIYGKAEQARTDYRKMQSEQRTRTMEYRQRREAQLRRAGVL